MYSRKEYLEMLQKDLQRLQGNSASIDAENTGNIDAGITVKTTIGGKTTVARTAQKNIGSVTTSIGCLDFSRIGDPHVPDGTYVDGVRIEEETVDLERNEYLEMLQKDLQRIQNNGFKIIKTPDSIASTPESEAKALDNSSSTSKIVSVTGNQRIENEIKKGQPFILETSLGPDANFTKINDVKINHDSRLFGSPKQHGGEETTNRLATTNDFSNTPSKPSIF